MRSEGIKGKVYLVGAGPGDPGLITVRAAELIKQADCIICDKLVNPVLLNLSKKEAEIVEVPKRIGSGSVSQSQINKIMVEKAGQYKIVVRLKGGDPCIFGRMSEEINVLSQAGIEFEIVPGITAGIAVSAYAGVILTDRQYSSQVLFITGREAEDKAESNIDWAWLAKFTGTIVFYMSVGNLDFIVEKLLQNQMSPETPAAAIENVSLPNQRIIKSRLGELCRICSQYKLEPPAIIVIGKSAQLDSQIDWFFRKPLFGKNIVITRDNEGNKDFAAKLIREAANPIEFPTIKLCPLTKEQKFVQALGAIKEYEWVIFTSPNGVKIFFDCLDELGKDARIFASAKIAAVGSETAQTLKSFGLNADFVPAVFTSAELGRGLCKFTNLKHKRILLLRSRLASKELPKILEDAGAEINDVAVYTTKPQDCDGSWLKEEIVKNRIDWITFASPMSAQNFFSKIPAGVINTNRLKVASIGPITDAKLESVGVNIAATASEHTIDGIISAMKDCSK